jgi:hypothetical protein
MDDELTLEIDKFGNRFWRNANGDLHRLDGPAAEWFDGTKSWFQNGKLHRLDGPAREYFHGTKEWWRYGIQFTNKESFFDALTEEEKGFVLFLEDFLNG